MINSAVFISAGLGDAILLVPLVKKLKESGRKVTGIFSSDFNCEEIFEGTSLFDEQLLFPSETNNKISRTAIVLKHIRKFDEVYLNYFSCTRSNFMLASVISKKVISNRIPNGFPQMLLLNLSYVEPKENIHDSTQNLRLFDSSVTDKDIREDMFLVPFRPVCLLPDFDKIKNNGKTIAVQISSGNNIHKYKNWPTEHWAEFLLRATQTFPKINFVMIGEPNETAISEELMKRGFPNLFSFVGRTNIEQLIYIINNSDFFVGLDGGPMHIAVASGKPTFTIWGASDFNLYGYKKFNPVKHEIVFSSVECRPCNAWIAPNTSRVKNPALCPDYMCMQSVTPQHAFDRFYNFTDIF